MASFDFLMEEATGGTDERVCVYFSVCACMISEVMVGL